MPTFYVDESGFTGEDLLAATQPVFAHATTDFAPDDARWIVESVFKGVNAKELKYAQLRKNAGHRQRILELVRTVAADPGRAAIWIAHKEYALLTLIVDWWMEPLAQKHGLNLYEDGANLGMANMLFYCLEGFWSREFRRDLLLRFQHMIRTRTPKAFSQCEEFVRRAAEKADSNRKDVLRYFGPSFVLLGRQHVRGLPDRVLDIALPGLIFLGHIWRGRHDGPWEVVHDQSSNMAKQKWLWDALSSPELATATFDNPGGAQHFPMNVISTRFAASESERQLQICDVLAGATVAFLRNRVRAEGDQRYFEQLAMAGIENLIVGGLWPSTEVTPEGLGMRGWDGNRAIEWISEQMAAARKD